MYNDSIGGTFSFRSRRSAKIFFSLSLPQASRRARGSFIKKLIVLYSSLCFNLSRVYRPERNPSGRSLTNSNNGNQREIFTVRGEEEFSTKTGSPYPIDRSFRKFSRRSRANYRYRAIRRCLLFKGPLNNYAGLELLSFFLPEKRGLLYDKSSGE